MPLLICLYFFRSAPKKKRKVMLDSKMSSSGESSDDIPLLYRFRSKSGNFRSQGAEMIFDRKQASEKKGVAYFQKRISCGKCGEKFKIPDMASHLRDHETKPVHPCDFCDKVFVCIYAWHRHGFKLHGKQLRCNECGRRYNYVDRFIRHLRYGHAEKSYICTVCNNYSTSISARLRKHIEQTHMKQYIGYCDICSKGFFDKTYLEDHKNLHSGDSPHQCELCGKSFRLKTTLRAHRFKFHLELFPYVCHTCKKGFATKSGLDAHAGLHAENRQYICDYCGKHLTTVATLTEHRRMHTGEFPFKCDTCNKAFRAKKHLTRHQAAHSGTHSEKNHECHYCNKKFSNVNACLHHTRKCHENCL